MRVQEQRAPRAPDDAIPAEPVAHTTPAAVVDPVVGHNLASLGRAGGEGEAQRVAGQVSGWPEAPNGRPSSLDGRESARPAVSIRDNVPPVARGVLATVGRPLDAATRASFTAGMGHDFSRVRVHADAEAAASARAVHSLAYTVGDHLVFGAGNYDPRSSRGRALLAHELTHTVQQRFSGVPVLQRAPDSADPVDPLVAQVEQLAIDFPTGPSAQGYALTEYFSGIDAMSVQEQALVIGAVAKFFPEPVAVGFAEWIARRQINPYEKAMELEPPGFLAAIFLMPLQDRANAFVEGFVEGATFEPGAKLQILGKLALGPTAIVVFNGPFLAGALHGAALSIADLVSTLAHLPEILQQLDLMIKKLLSEEGVAFARELGVITGDGWARELTDVGEMSLPELAYFMGKKLGPLLAGILISLVTGAIFTLAWRSWTLALEGFDALVDLSKLRLAQRIAGVRVLTEPPALGKVLIHKEGNIEYWAPAELASELTPAAAAGRPFVPNTPGGTPGVPGAQVPAVVTPPTPAGAQVPAVATATGGTATGATATGATATGATAAGAAQATAVTGLGALAEQAIAAEVTAGTIVPLTTMPAELVDLLGKVQALALANPGAVADIDRVLQLTPIVWKALQKPELYGAAVEVLETYQQQVPASVTDIGERYAEGLKLLARDRRIDVTEVTFDDVTEMAKLTGTAGGPGQEVLSPGGLIPAELFLRKLIGGGQMFIDRPALAQLPVKGGLGAHGALSHTLQDLVVDEDLRSFGLTSVQYRQLLLKVSLLQGGSGAATWGEEFAGTAIWMQTYDALDDGLGQPESFWPVIRDLLLIPPGTM